MSGEPGIGSSGKGLRRLLSIPFLYSGFQLAIGAKESRKRFVAEHLRPQPRQKVLDIGCGTGEILEFLGEPTYVGFDPEKSYIGSAKARYGKLGEFSVGSVSEPPLLDSDFDLALAMGVVHHLDDTSSIALMNLARSHLLPGARLVTFDPVLVPGQHPVARMLAKRDRGAFVRSRAEYEAIARTVFQSVEVTEHHDYLRVPYSHLVMECG